MQAARWLPDPCGSVSAALLGSAPACPVEMIAGIRLKFCSENMVVFAPFFHSLFKTLDEIFVNVI